MQNVRRIVVGVDLTASEDQETSTYSEAAHHAIEQAFWLAEQVSAELVFASVLDFTPAEEALLLGDQYTNTVDTWKAETRDLLNALLERAKEQNIKADAVVVQGTAWKELIRLVLRHKADLLLVGTRHHSTAEQFLFGSTGMQVLRHCPSPVWITRRSPVLDDEVLDILIPTDFDEMSTQAVHLGIQTAQLIESRVHLLHVLEDSYKGHLWARSMSAEEREELQQKETRAAEEKVNHQLSQTDYRALTYGVQPEIIRGRPEVAILHKVTEDKIDLVVMPTLGRSGIKGFFIGNTAERILQSLPCSLLAIKPDDFECKVKQHK